MGEEENPWNVLVEEAFEQCQSEFDENVEVRAERRRLSIGCQRARLRTNERQIPKSDGEQFRKQNAVA